MFSSILSFHGLPIASAGLSWKSYVALVLIVFCDNTAWRAWTKNLTAVQNKRYLVRAVLDWGPSRSWREHFRDEAPGSDVLSRRCRKMVGTRSCAIRRRTSKDGAIAGRSMLMERVAAPKAQECYGRSSKKEASRHAAPYRERVPTCAVWLSMAGSK
jgi:hypothetical protein